MQREAMMITVTHLVDVEILQPKSRKNPQKDLVETLGFEEFADVDEKGTEILEMMTEQLHNIFIQEDLS